MAIATIALGSNVGDRADNILKALRLMTRIGTINACSGMYETLPWGLKEQPCYLNAVATLEVGAIAPQHLLKTLKAIEDEIGRTKRVHWGPREIDLDILYLDDLSINEDSLVIPHPFINQRAFVLAPLCEINSSSASILESLPAEDKNSVHRIADIDAQRYVMVGLKPT